MWQHMGALVAGANILDRLLVKLWLHKLFNCLTIGHKSVRNARIFFFLIETMLSICWNNPCSGAIFAQTFCGNVPLGIWLLRS